MLLRPFLRTPPGFSTHCAATFVGEQLRAPTNVADRGGGAESLLLVRRLMSVTAKFNGRVRQSHSIRRKGPKRVSARPAASCGFSADCGRGSSFVFSFTETG